MHDYDFSCKKVNAKINDKICKVLFQKYKTGQLNKTIFFIEKVQRMKNPF